MSSISFIYYELIGSYLLIYYNYDSKFSSCTNLSKSGFKATSAVILAKNCNTRRDMGSLTDSLTKIFYKPNHKRGSLLKLWLLLQLLWLIVQSLFNCRHSFYKEPVIYLMLELIFNISIVRLNKSLYTAINFILELLIMVVLIADQLESFCIRLLQLSMVYC